MQPRRDNAPEQERSNGRVQEEKGVVLNRSVQTRLPNSSYTHIIPVQSSKNVAILSSLHPDVQVSSDKNLKKKPDFILYYRVTKIVVDLFDQMAQFDDGKCMCFIEYLRFSTAGLSTNSSARVRSAAENIYKR